MAKVSLRFLFNAYLLFCIASYRIICEINNGDELSEYSEENDHRLPHNVMQDDCEQSMNNHKEFLLVSTLDGRVTALDPTDGGRVVWSVATGPGEMLSSSISRLEVPSRGHWVRIIPSLDGNLYKFDGKIIEPIPLSTESLLQNSFKLGDDLVVIGGKETRSYGVNLQTGKLRYICTMEGCSSIDEKVSSTEDILIIQRQTQIVRAVHSRTGVEQWNFSVGEHRISMAKRLKDDFTNNEINEKYSVLDQGDVFITYKKGDCSSASSSSLSVKVVMPDGFIAAVDGISKHFIWSHKLPSPIVNVWQLQEDILWSLDLFSHETLVGMDQNNEETLLPPLLYIGFHEKQLYIKHSEEMKIQVEGAVKSYLLSSQLVMPQVQWKPYIATAQSRTPFIDIGRKDVSNDDPTAVILKEDFDYPYDNGFYLYGSTKLISVIDNSSQCSASELQEEETFEQIVIVSLWHWWKEVIAIAIGSSVFVHLLVTRRALKKINLMKENSNSQEIQIVNPCIISRNPELAAVIENKSERNHNKLEQYTSRYLTDFEPLECLGKGGFGVVFEARNKIDDCNYAVKRIGLKNREDALEKVMREVKALAKLDHPGIVRYFNAWLESPPPGWQEEKDKEWDEWSKMSSTSFSSTAVSATENGERKILKSVNPLKPYDIFASDASHGFAVNRLEDESGSFSVENLPSEQQPLRSTASDSFEVVFNHSRKSAGDASSIGQEELHKGKFTYSFSELKRNEEMPFCNCKHSDNANDSLIISLEDSGWGDRSRSTMEELWEKDNMKNGQLIISNKSKVSRPSVLNFSEKKSCENSASRIYLYIQMQLCRKESLKDWLSCNTVQRDRLEVLDIFDQIVSAVQYVHECGLMHRDLKPSNIFFSMDGTIKVGDFGLVTAVADAHTPAGNFIDKEVNPLVKHTDQVGTQLYMSPEQISGYTYSHKVDIFSLGLIFFELLTPFSTQSERIKVLLNVRRQKFPNDFRKNKYEECQFASKLLSHIPEERPSAAEIIQHPLFKDFQPQPTVINRAKRRRTLSQRMSSSSSDCDTNPLEGTENLLSVPS